MAVAVAPRERRPIRLVVHDDELRRSRLTVFFRLFLFLPHLVWLGLWGFAANLVAFVLWLAILIEGRAPTSLHDFVAGYVRYATHAGAYLFLAAGPYPGFRGAPGYPVDLEIEPPARQSRLSALVRILLALPALMLAATLGAGLAWSAIGALVTFGIAFLYAGSGLAGTAAFLTWFAALVTGRSPRGLRDAIAYALDYNAQASGYLLLLTGRYPTSDPRVAEGYAELPDHPVALVLDDELRRSRLTVLFRLLLAIPHILWILLWSVVAFFAALAAWLVALVAGRVPDALHRFLAAYVRYGTHVAAFVYLVGGRFPGFTGRAGSYGVDLEIAPRARQSRWKTLFRLVLGIPALLLAGAFGAVAFVVAFLGWFYALVTGRMPEGLRNLGAASLRYSAQTYAYTLLVTDRYPYAAPVLRDRPLLSEPPTPLPMLLLPPPQPHPPGPLPGGTGAGIEIEPRKTDYVAVAIVAALVLAAGVLGVLGIRALSGQDEGVLRVVAPPGGCWSIASGRDERELLATHTGCGVREIPFDPSGFEAQLSVEPPTEEYALGAMILVDGEVVRHVAPAIRSGLRVRHGDDMPEKMLVIRIEASQEGCWTAVVDDAPEKGCGPRTLDLGMTSTVSFVVERDSRGRWPLFVAVEADGEVVQTFGPDRGEFPRISGGYSVPRPVE